MAGHVPTISVIVHNLNRADILARCLASLAAQGVRPLEVVIADAGSTDGSHLVIERACAAMAVTDIAVRRIECRPAGVASSRNLAAREASGDLLCFLDNDALLEPADALAGMRDLFLRQPELGIVAFKILSGDSEALDPFAWVFRRSTGWSTRPFRTFTFAGAGFCVRRDAFWSAGGFWEQLTYSREEEDLALELLDRGWGVLYSPSVVVRHYFDPRGRMDLARRRSVELRNGLLVLWRRFPLPLAVPLVFGRIATMSLRTLVRERRSPAALLGGVREALPEWRGAALRRKPISVRGVCRYAALHVPR
jgi:GT2 family glycosyltransferase